MQPATRNHSSWSSATAFYLSAVGASVGLGSIWRFPYLAGTSGGGAFIFIFVLALMLIAVPLLVAEFAIGRQARCSAPQAAGVVAVQSALSPRWRIIGILGTVAAFWIASYYTVIAGWVLAYAWKCARGDLEHQNHLAVAALRQAFLADPVQMGAWHLAFLGCVALVSARGVNRGIELANRIRAPALLLLLCVLVAYALAVGDVRHGIDFAFGLHWSQVTPQVVLAAIGQAFFATGVGMAMMIAYGQYVSAGTSLLRSALIVAASILLVSLLASVLVFPLVFRYGMNPSQGITLVFDVLPTVFAEMPAGRLLGTLFFVLLVFAAFTPTIAILEPIIAWLVERWRMPRALAVFTTAAAAWLLGLASMLSFNLWAHRYPLAFIGRYEGKTVFDISDDIASNMLLPVGALLTSAFVGWRVARPIVAAQMVEASPRARVLCVLLLRFLCPVAILLVLATALL
ncbi:MAG: sodium-dependent transporter [Gammaproteobacteria bacterium]|nr:sodium-dependent transporter [Gammaproteobacteria bacterium]